MAATNTWNILIFYFLPACVLCPPATNCKRTVALRWAESLQILFNLFPSLWPLSIWAFWWTYELDQWEQQEKIRGGGSWGLRCVQWYPVIPKDAYCGCCYDLCSVCVAFLAALLECTFYLILKGGSCTDIYLVFELCIPGTSKLRPEGHMRLVKLFIWDYINKMRFLPQWWWWRWWWYAEE